MNWHRGMAYRDIDPPEEPEDEPEAVECDDDPNEYEPEYDGPMPGDH